MWGTFARLFNLQRRWMARTDMGLEKRGEHHALTWHVGYAFYRVGVCSGTRLPRGWAANDIMFFDAAGQLETFASSTLEVWPYQELAMVGSRIPP
ncbi:jg8515 [Pararge aegeria aegeria]|uniref:Jg8515 protein n=1 Tax=Pararge aegeria aegeria TaxID=348720 RepID=A0A8S4RCW1_9NEOP|nr:jg8515 [Pararge aegeria aegeria]